jgi:hypothetical protein
MFWARAKKVVRIFYLPLSPGPASSIETRRNITINPHHHHHKWNFHLALSTHHVAAPPLLLD